MTSSRPRRRALRTRTITLTLLVVALSLGAAATQAGTALIVRAPVAAPDVIVSLASHEWERLPVAARLARENPAAIVLLTRPRHVTEFNCHDCDRRSERLAHFGVAASRVQVVTLTAEGTYGEAVAALEFARRVPVRRLLVVTSPYHTRRSLAVFRKVFQGTGIDIGAEPALAASRARPERWWLEGDDRSYVPYEWAALVYYGWKYGVSPLL